MTNAVSTLASLLTSTTPEPGQLAEARTHQWIIADLDAPSVSPELPERNLVKIALIDESALGEEIKALWELKAGAQRTRR